MSDSSQDLSFLAGGGEMGERTRSFDWAAHPLGRPENWPQSLKIAIRILLTSRYAMWIGWGSEFYFFCNDAYSPTLGNKQDWALGASARKVWAEIWPDVGPRAESVVATGNATWDESLLLFLERSGFPEETYHTFSYSPLPDDAGGVGGMLSVVTEETDRIINERRLTLVRELASQLGLAQTSPQVFAGIQQCLAARPADVPFALVYLFENGGKSARLACLHGVEPASAMAPAWIDCDPRRVSEAVAWPGGAMLDRRAEVVVDHLRRRFGEVPTGPWDIPPRLALLVPLAGQGQDRPAGFLVAGVNPYRPLDAAYKGFVGLLAGQIAAALSNADAYEAEHQRAEALAELDHAKTEFFGNVSHEFRTPLTLMLSPVEEVLSDHSSELSEYNRERLGIVHRNGLRLQKLVNTLLDFSRIEAGRVQMACEPVNLAEYTADLASLFRSAVERAGLRLEVDCPPLSEPVYVDRDMWEKIVLNLLSNAFKHTFEGSIRVALRPTGNNTVELTVSDTGTGIPSDAVPRLFERFFRVLGARSRTHEGSGIGLAIVQELIKLHKGTIEVTSRLGVGTTFTVSLPLGTAHLSSGQFHTKDWSADTRLDTSPFEQEAIRWIANDGVLKTKKEPEPESSPVASAGSQARPRVVLADDNADMREYVGRLLSPHYSVDAHPDGESALQAARREKPDLILTDVMMPRLNGIDLLRAVRADDGLKDVPIIVLSARAGEESQIEGLERGADDYLVKPFSAKEVIARVGAKIELARIRRESMEREANLAAETTRILESITDAFVAMDEHFQLTYANAEAERIYGMGRDELIGKVYDEVFPAPRGTVAEREFSRAMRDRVKVDFEMFHQPWQRWFEVHAYPSPTGGLAVYFKDITEQKRIEGVMAGQRQALELAVQGAPLKDILDVLVRTAETQTSTEIVGSIMLLDEDGVRLRSVSAPSLSEAYFQAVDGVRIGPSVGTCATAAYTGQIVITENIATDPGWEQFRGMAMEHGFQSCWSTPIFSSRKTVLGTFGLYHRHKQAPSAQERETVGLLSHTAAVVIERHQETKARVAAEAALREEEQRFRNLANSAPAMLWLSDATGGRTFLSRGWYDFTGREDGSGLDLQWLDVLHPDDRGPIKQSYLHAIVNHRSFEIDYRLLRADKQYRWVVSSGRPRFDESGTYIGHIGSVIDITDRKRAEESLKRSEAFARGIMENSPDCVKILSVEGRLVWMNEAGKRLMEVDDFESIRDLPWTSFWEHGQSERGAEQALEAAKHGDVGRFQGLCPTVKGKRKWWDVAVVAIPGRKGKPEQLLSVSRDVTEQRRVQIAVLENEERLRLAAKATNDAIWDADLIAGRYVWSPAMADMFGWKEVVDGVESDWWMDRVHHDDRASVQKTLADVFGNSGASHWQAEYRFRRSDGSYAEVLDRGYVIRLPGGQAVRMVGAMLDITARKLAEQELDSHRRYLEQIVEARTRELQESHQRLRLSERMALLGTLSAGLGHDMGNLLVPIRVRLESLDNAGLSDELKEDVGVIRTSADYLKRLANGLRLLAVDPELASSDEATELSSWWADVEAIYKNMLPRNVVLRSSIPSEPCSVSMSKSGLTQVVFNIVQNAGDAMKSRGTGTVTITVAPGDEEVRVQVTDDGPGMTEEIKRRCMEPFFTTKPRGISTGIGLVLVSGLVREAGGRVELESEPNVGTTFTLVLRRAPAAIETSDTPTSGFAVVQVKDARMRAFVTAELRMLSHGIQTGLEGADPYPDVVVLDIDDATTDACLARGAKVIVVGESSRKEETGFIALGKKPKTEAVRRALREAARASVTGGPRR